MIVCVFGILISSVALSGCFENTENKPPVSRNYREDMRDFVQNISVYAKGIDPHFIIIPQNGQELVTDSGEPDGVPQTDYLQAIDATGREGLFYGYDNDDQETPEEDKQILLDLCLIYEQFNVEVLVTDYCFTHSKMNDSYQVNEQNDFISFAASERELNTIPEFPESPFNDNRNNITNISQAKNFLYLINSENFSTKQDFINAVAHTNYDLVIMDLFHDQEAFNATEIEQLRTKENGGKRLVICYISIGESEDYRYYWHPEWETSSPSWLAEENPEWEGNYKVRYWDNDWQDIIFGNNNSYMKKIVDAGFDGAYLDIIDAFEYFEEQ